MTLPIGVFLTVWGLLAVNVLSPGPNVLNTIASAMGSGWRAGFGSACGVGVGIGLWCLGMSLGMAALFALLPIARILLTLVAVGLLLWFATGYIRTAIDRWRQGGQSNVGQRKGLSFASSFRRSLLVNVLNPKALTSWLAILAIFPVARATGGDIALLCLGACVLSFTIHTAYAAAFSTPFAAAIYARHAWIVSGLTALFFLGFALSILLELVRS